jgi:hypothetical protein
MYRKNIHYIVRRQNCASFLCGVIFIFDAKSDELFSSEKKRKENVDYASSAQTFTILIVKEYIIK